MPKSRHRKIPFRTRVEQRKRDDRMDKQAEARRLIYERALPEHQEYPPTLYTQSALERRERVAKIKAQAEERRQRRHGVVKELLAA